MIMNKKILFLNHQIDQIYTPIKHVQQHFPFAFDSFNPTLGELPENIAPYSHIVISGSISSVLEDSGWLQAEKRCLQKAIDQGKNILGICFGHQLLATLLFGMDKVFRRDYPVLGWTKTEVELEDVLLGQKGDILYGFSYHFDEVRDLPVGEVDILLSSELCPIEAFRYRGHNVWGVQTHFEIDEPTGQYMLNEYLEKDDFLWDHVLNKEEKPDSHYFSEMSKRFFDLS